MMLKYKGGGFIPDVPARDLTDDEANAYGIESLLTSGLYERVEPKAKKEVKTEDTNGRKDTA
jgi:hypothetical protein